MDKVVFSKKTDWQLFCQAQDEMEGFFGYGMLFGLVIVALFAFFLFGYIILFIWNNFQSFVILFAVIFFTLWVVTSLFLLKWKYDDLKKAQTVKEKFYRGKKHD